MHNLFAEMINVRSGDKFLIVVESLVPLRIQPLIGVDMTTLYARGKTCSSIYESGFFAAMPRCYIREDNTPTIFARLVSKCLKKRIREEKRKNTFDVAYHPGFSCNLSCKYCYQFINDNNNIHKPTIKNL